MRSLWCHKYVVILLFLGIAGGHALPYSVVYGQVVKPQLSCYCCDHGKISCKHCAEYGHKLKSKKREQKVIAFKAIPCRTSQPDPHVLNFTTDPCLIPETKIIPVEFEHWILEQSDKMIQMPIYEPLPDPPRDIA